MPFTNTPDLDKTDRLGKWSGLDNTNQPLDVGWSGLVEATNFDADRNLKYTTRKGYTKVFSGTVDASWSDGRLFLFLSGGNLYRMNADSTYDNLGAVPGTQLAAAEVSGRVYLHTDKFRGFWQAGQLRQAVDLPDNVSVTVGAGALQEGRYFITATAVDTDGREGGAYRLIGLDVPANSSISVSVNTEMQNAYVYVSARNGRELYLYSVGKTATISQPSDTLSLNNLCKRVHYGIPPVASIMAAHRGRMFFASGNYLAYSDPFDYEQIDYQTNLIPLDSQVTMLSSVETGVFVSTQTEIRFLRTDENSNVALDPKPYSLSAKPGSAAGVDMVKVGDGSSGRGVIFATEDGICLGTPDGSIQNLTRRKLAFTDSNSGTATVKGSQYLLALH